MSLWSAWSKTKLEDAVTCMRRLHYVYIQGVPRDITVPLAAGIFVHAGCKRFNDPHQERPHFKSAQTYAGHRVGVWKRFIAKPKSIARQPVHEAFEGEIWAAAATTIQPSSLHFYELFAGRDKPLAVEFPFKMRIGDFTLSGSFDALGKGLRYIDFKTSALKKNESLEETKPLHDHELRHDYQFTIYSAALPVLASHYPALADHLCLTPLQQKTLRSNPLLLMSDAVGERVDLTRGRTYEIRRTPKDLVELLNTIESCALRAEQCDFSHSRGYHCQRCHVKNACDRDWEKGRILEPEEIARCHSEYMLFPPRMELKVYIDVPSPIMILGGQKRANKKAESEYPLFPA